MKSFVSERVYQTDDEAFKLIQTGKTMCLEGTHYSSNKMCFHKDELEGLVKFLFEVKAERETR